jgi:hypothetical protein
MRGFFPKIGVTPRLEFAEFIIGRRFAPTVGSFEPPSPTRAEGKGPELNV